MKISARPHQRDDARGSPEAASRATGGDSATAELRPPTADAESPAQGARAPNADADRESALVGDGQEAPSGALLGEGDVDAVLDRVLTLAPAPVTSGPVSLVGIRQGHSTAGDRAAVRATFEDLAVLHISPIRNLMLEVRWGEPPLRFISLARPALQSLRAMAHELELDDLVRALDGFDGALAEVLATEARSIAGEQRERLLGAYFPLQRSFPGAFGLEGGRERREPIIIDALLEPVAGVDQEIMDRLCLVGLGRLEPLLKARADEIAVVANIPRLVADRIVARVSDLVNSAPTWLPGRRALEDWLLGELTRSQLLLRLRRGERLERIDLGRARLPGVLLAGVTLAGANLENANLTGAVLLRADLRGARLRGANLAGADLSEANLQNADLVGADLSGANLTGANLSRANLISACCAGARLGGVRLSFASLTAAQLDGATLEGANLTHADLERASLQGVRAQGADFTGAFFKGTLLRAGQFGQARFDEANLERARADGANFEGASFAGAELRGADLVHTDLRGADFSGALLEEAVLTGARVAGLIPSDRPCPGLRADWVLLAGEPRWEAREPGGAQASWHVAALVSHAEAGDWQPERGHRFGFGGGEVLADALLEVGEGSRLTVDALLHRCLVQLRPGSELVVEEAGALLDCQVLGGGHVVIRGKVVTAADADAAAIAGARTITVEGRALLVATVAQPPELTRFTVAHGARLRLQILNPDGRDSDERCV